MDWEDRQRAGAYAMGGLSPAYLEWARWSGAPITVVLTAAFGLLTTGWVFLVARLSFFDYWRLAFINEHFVLDLGDLAAGRYHVLLTHAFLYNDLIHMMFMLVGLLIFCSAVEWRSGSISALLLFFAGVIGGGWLQITINSNEGMSFLARYIESEAILQWLESHRDVDNTFQGPAAGVWALMTAALFYSPFKRCLQDNILFFGYVIIFVMADWFGFFHFEMSVGYGARVGGAFVGLGFVACRLVLILGGAGWRWTRSVRARNHRRIATKPSKQKQKQNRMDVEVDKILEKISESGEESLTPKEREFLIKASEQKKRRQ